MEPLRLDQIGDDALQSVFLALDNFAQDVLFVALTCHNFLRALRLAVRRRDTKRRHRRFLVPDPNEDGKLRTSVSALFLSATRLEFAKRQLHPKCLPVAHLFGVGTPLEWHTETFWHMIKVAPCSVIRDALFRKELMHGSTQWRALLQFSARHGRVDVLQALGSHEAQEKLGRDIVRDELFTSEARHALFAHPLPPDGEWARPERAFINLVQALLRPALVGRQTKVLLWFQETALLYAAGDHYYDHIGKDGVAFAGMCLRQDPILPGSHYSHESERQLYMLVADAAKSDFAAPIEAFLEQIIDQYRYIAQVSSHWLCILFYKTVVTILNLEKRRGSVVSAVARVCAANQSTLRRMFGVNGGEDQPFGLVELDALWHPYLGVGHLTNDMMEVVFYGGDAHYVHWLLTELFDEFAPPRFLRGLFERIDYLVRELPRVCRFLIQVCRVNMDHRRDELKLPRLCDACKYQFHSTETFLYADALRSREGLDDLDPTELERGMAWAARRWITHVLVTPDAPTGIPMEWYETMEFAPVAMLPHMNNLYFEYARTPRQQKVLRDLVIGAAATCFTTAGGAKDKTAMISHLALAYRYGIVSRSTFNAAFGNDMRTCGRPVPRFDVWRIDANLDDVDAGRLFADVDC